MVYLHQTIHKDMKTSVGRYCGLVFCSFLVMTRISEAVQVIGGSRTATQGEDVDLFCQLIQTDEELTQITWQKKTREFPGDHNFFVISPSGSTQHVNGLRGRVRFIGNTKDNVGSISLSGVRLLDEGTYTCIFTVFPSGPFKTEIPLNVLVPPVMNVTVDVPPVKGEREVVLATCTAAGAKPPAEVRWNTGGLNASVRTLTNSTQHANGTTTVRSYLLGVPSGAVDHQEVQCVVNQSALATEATLNYTIDIHYPPVSVNIIVSDTSQDSVFRCVAVANPEATYTWSRVSPPGPGSVVGEGETLPLLSLGSEPSGLYVCEASNPYGRAAGSLYVHHLAPVGNCRVCWAPLLLGLLLVLIGAAVLGYYYKHRKLPGLDVCRTPLQVCLRKEGTKEEEEEESTVLPSRRPEEESRPAVEIT